MILGFKQIGTVCAVFLLVSPSSFPKSAVASVNHQAQLIAQGQTKIQSHPVFRSILPKLKQKNSNQDIITEVYSRVGWGIPDLRDYRNC